MGRDLRPRRTGRHGRRHQAVRLALQAVCVAGDVVAIERPAWFGALLLLESMGLKALEIATDPQEGISLPALNEAIVSYRPAAVLVSPSAQNPTGAVMPVAAKRSWFRCWRDTAFR